MVKNVLPPAFCEFDTLPDSALVDVRTLALLLGCSENTVWRRAKPGGLLPVPIRISPQQTRWRVGAVREALVSVGEMRGVE